MDTDFEDNIPHHKDTKMENSTNSLGYNEDHLDGSEGEEGKRHGSYEMNSEKDSECDSISDEGSYSLNAAEKEYNNENFLQQGKYTPVSEQQRNDRLRQVVNGRNAREDGEIDEVDSGEESETDSQQGDVVNAQEDPMVNDIEMCDDSESEIGSYHVNSDQEEERLQDKGNQSDAEYDLPSNESSDLEDTMDEVELLRMKVLKRQENPELPETVSLLITPQGAKVYVIGTAHFSDESQEDVAKTIQAVQPDVVLLELCKSRLSILELDEATLLEEAQNLNFAKLRQSVKQSGVIGGVMQVLLLSMSAHLTKELGMAPGGEFRRAFREAQTIPGCRVHLGDRPIQITLKRAMSSLSSWQKLRLAWYLITSKESITKDDVEKYKQKDLLEEMMLEMTGEFPGLSDVFVHERDLFLSQSLKACAQAVPQQDSQTGYYLPVVVGVVGMGHVAGIKAHWHKHVTKAEIEAIVRIPPLSLTSRVVSWSLRASVMGILFYGCYRCVRLTGLSLW